MPSEFEIIERCFASVSTPDESISLGIGDDCALVRVSQPTELAFSIDTLVEGVHFLTDISPEDLAWRLLGSSISDLAAMGAQPRWLTLAITTPKDHISWLAPFSKALTEACERFSIRLIGGDTTSGPCRVLSAQVHGEIPSVGAALKRSGAQPGDLVCVSGTLGDSRAGLALLMAEVESQSESGKRALLSRYFRPEPRLELGQLLVGRATAAIDISDGFLADLKHLLDCSGVGAEINLDCLPCSSDLKRLVDPRKAIDWACSGGEDFELCFTLPAGKISEIQSVSSVPVTVVGQITEKEGLQLKCSLNSYETPTKFGFDHFGESLE